MCIRAQLGRRPPTARVCPGQWSSPGGKGQRYGEVYHVPAVCYRRSLTPVRESIYIDAGEWRYLVSQMVTHRGMANLLEGDRIEVAVDGRSLILRVGSKRYTTQIVHKFRGKPVSPPASLQ